MIEQIKKEVGYSINYDIVQRDIKKYKILFISSLVDEETINNVCKGIIRNNYYFQTANISKESNLNVAINRFLSGCILVEYENDLFVIEARSYPLRSIKEPENEKTINGAHDGFVESLKINTALIRRRIKNKSFQCNLINVANNDITINYLKDKVNESILSKIQKKLESLTIKNFPLGSKELARQLLWNEKLSLFPQFRNTERADIASLYILKGYIVILIDCSSSAIIIPSSFFMVNEQIEEYQLNPIISFVNKVFRFFCMFIGLFLLPLWLIISKHGESFTSFFIVIDKIDYQRLYLEIITVQIILNAIRLASFNTPSPLMTTMSIVSAIVLGSIVTSISIINEEVIFYCALSSICIFSLSNYETSKAISLWNLILIFLTGKFGKNGFLIGCIILFISLVSIKNYGSYYLEPFIPFKIKKIK